MPELHDYRARKVTEKEIRGYGTFGVYRLPHEHVPMRYYDAYNILFRLENVLRALVYVVLKAGKGRDWLDTRIPGPDGTPGISISDQAKARTNALRRQGYTFVGRFTRVQIMWLDFDELRRIMAGPDRGLFDRVFQGATPALVSKLDEARNIRNNLAHFRAVTEDDICRLYAAISELEPLVDAYLHVLTADGAGATWYKKGRPDLAALSAYASQNLARTGTAITLSRTDDWLSVLVLQVITNFDFSEAEHAASMWALDREKLWRELKARQVDDCVLFFRARSELRAELVDDVPDQEPFLHAEGYVSVDYRLPWYETRQKERTRQFVKTLVEVFKETAEPAEAAAIETPRILKQYEVGLDEDVAAYDFVGESNDVTDVIEDWTGTDAICGILKASGRLPWVREDISTSGDYYRGVEEHQRHMEARRNRDAPARRDNLRWAEPGDASRKPRRAQTRGRKPTKRKAVPKGGRRGKRAR